MYGNFMENVKTQSERRMEHIRKSTEERWERWEKQFKPITKTETTKGI